MPPEFLRKGRFYEIFFVNFPKEAEIEEIIKVHIRKRHKTDWLEKIDIKKFIKKMEKKRFSGADVEAVVKEAVETAFVEKRNDVTTDDFLKMLKDFKTISETMKEEISTMEEKAKNMVLKPLIRVFKKYSL